VPDNFVTNPGAGGLTFRSLPDAGGVEWPAGVTAYVVTAGTPNVLQLVDPTHGLPVAPASGVTFAVTGTFWQSTQPVSLASVPTHAVTQSGVWSVVTDINSYGGMTAIVANYNAGGFQGVPLHGLALPGPSGAVAGGTAANPVRTDPTGTTAQPVNGTVASGAADSGNPVKVGGVYRAASVTLADGQRSDLQLNVNGYAIVSVGNQVSVRQSGGWTVGAQCQDGAGNSLTSATRGAQQALSVQIVDASGNQVTSFGGSGGTASNYGSAFPATGTSAGYSDGANMQGARVFDLDSGAGSQYVLGVGLRLSASGGSVEAGTGTNPIRTDPTGTTTQPVSGTFWQATQPVSGTVIVNAGTGTFNIQANASVNLNQVGGSAFALGQQLAAGSLPVVLTAAQLTTLTPPTAVTANQGGAPWSNNVTQLGGTAVDTNSGAKSAGTLRVVLATDQPALTNKLLVTPDANASVNLNQIGGGGIAQGHGTATGALRVELPTDGTGVVGLAAGANLVGKVGIDQTTPGTTNGVTPVPATSGGPTLSRVKSAASTNATNLKASAGQVYGWALFNTTSSAKFLKFYNKASSPTVGTDTPVMTIPIPANGGTNIEFSMGMPFGTGIAYAITGAVGDSDTTSTAADDVHGTILYK
jgi:hypothetical protein